MSQRKSEIYNTLGKGHVIKIDGTKKNIVTRMENRVDTLETENSQEVECTQTDETTFYKMDKLYNKLEQAVTKSTTSITSETEMRSG